MFHGRKGLRGTGRWILLAAMALLLSGVGLMVAPGAGADKMTEVSGCGASSDAPVRSDEITIVGNCCSSGSSSLHSDETSGDGSSCSDTDGKGDGTDGDSDDTGGSGCPSDSSAVHSDTTTSGGDSSDCDEVGGVDDDTDGDDAGGTTGPTGPTGPTGTTGATGTTGTSGVTTTAASGIQQIKGASASKGKGKGKAKACTSRRLFVIHVRHPHGQYLVAANVTVNGKRVVTMRGHRLSSTIRLVGLPKGTVKVHIRAVTNAGMVLRGVRTYHTCAARRHGSVPKL
jgi:hypothetical protein